MEKEPKPAAPSSASDTFKHLLLAGTIIAGVGFADYFNLFSGPEISEYEHLMQTAHGPDWRETVASGQYNGVQPK